MKKIRKWVFQDYALIANYVGENKNSETAKFYSNLQNYKTTMDAKFVRCGENRAITSWVVVVIVFWWRIITSWIIIVFVSLSS